MDLVLRKARTTATLANALNVNSLGNHLQDLRRNQVVVENYIRRLQQAGGFNSQKARIARSGTYQIHFSVGHSSHRLNAP